ncbi:MAG: amino acid permease [Simkaniaceae bacterium]
MTLQQETLKPKGFGTFSGVFLPSVLTIFGVILYLRMGWIVGQAGVAKSITIIILASLITFITSLSLSSTATNMQIGSGGVYYVLSRTFGLKIGSAIGFPLFIAQSLSISFYIAGFSESIRELLPHLPPQTIQITILISLTLLTLASTRLALKTQFLIFILILFSLASFFLGGKNSPPLTPMLPKATSFWALFTLFFPAVTGIEAGISMSGDLKNPKRSLPLGTLTAVAAGAITYIALTLFLSHHVPQEVLISHPMIVREISLIPHLVTIGIWGATLSSSLSCLLAAPRTLSALAEDGHLPRFAAKPKFSLLITASFVLLGLFMGSIDKIAPVLSMFFLISYAMLNFAAGAESLIGNPSYRPTFRIPWWLSLFGTALCLTVMLMINAGQTLIALSFVLITYGIGLKRKLHEGFDDIREALLTLAARFAIYRLAETKRTARSWRPNLLVFIEDPFIRQNLVELTHSISHGQGFLLIASILNFDVTKVQFIEKMKHYLDKSHIPALIETCHSEDLFDGMKTFIKTAGMGPLTPNTLFFGATHKAENFSQYANVIKLAYKQNRNIVIVKEASMQASKSIDVWWGGLDRKNSDLMLVLAYMLKTSRKWQGSKLTLKTVITEDKDRDETLNRLKEFPVSGRLPVKLDVVIAESNKNIFQEVIKASSQNTDLIFMGLRPPKPDETDDEYGDYYKNLIEKTRDFPSMVFVLASEDIDFSQILK